MSIRSVTGLPPGVNKVTVLGYGISARSTIDFFLANEPELQLRVSELKPRENFDGIEAYEAQGVQFEFGQQSLGFIKADFVMVSPGIPPHAPIIQQLREAGVNMGTDLDLFMQLVPGKVLAVTGTNGKTTTASLLAHLFDTQALGNIGLPLLEFAKLENQEIFVLELSSAQIFYSQLLKPVDCSIYLNFSDDHLDWHKDLDEYREAKARLFKHDGLLVLNQDDATCKSLASANSKFFSTEAVTDAYYKDGALYLAGSELISCDDLKLVGKHNYSNILAAVLAASNSRLDRETIKTRLQSFEPVPHRLEYIATVNGHKCYNDSKATNPDSAIRALEAFDRSIAIVGGKNKNLDLSEFIKVLEQKAERVIAIGEIKAQFSIAKQVETLEQAVELAISHDSNLPIVLAPASSSFDMFSSYQERGDEFKRLVYNGVSASCSSN